MFTYNPCRVSEDLERYQAKVDQEDWHEIHKQELEEDQETKTAKVLCLNAALRDPYHVFQSMALDELVYPDNLPSITLNPEGREIEKAQFEQDLGVQLGDAFRRHDLIFLGNHFYEQMKKYFDDHVSDNYERFKTTETP